MDERYAERLKEEAALIEEKGVSEYMPNFDEVAQQRKKELSDEAFVRCNAAFLDMEWLD